MAAGVAVRVLDRADHVGGRMATRTVDGRAVDTGAAYFTVRDPEFAEIVARWRTAGLARPWTPELAVLSGDGPGRSPGPMRWSAPQGLRSLVEHLAVGLSVELNREVCRVGPGPTVDGESTDTVVLAMPDPQAVRLLHPSLRAYEAAAGRSWRPVVSIGCASFSARRVLNSAAPPSWSSMKRFANAPVWMSASTSCMRALTPASMMRGPET